MNYGITITLNVHSEKSYKIILSKSLIYNGVIYKGNHIKVTESYPALIFVSDIVHDLISGNQKIVCSITLENIHNLERFSKELIENGWKEHN